MYFMDDSRVEKFRREVNRYIEPTLVGMTMVVQYQKFLYTLPEGLEIDDLPSYEDFLTMLKEEKRGEQK
jgi:hypothetical protein